MSGILDYTKKFIILKNNFCNLPGKKPKGHGKIEVKGLRGSISLAVENAEGDQYYDVILLSGNNIYSPGKLYTEKAGKGREDISFNITDLEANGIKLNKLNGLLLVRDEKVLLGGYLTNEDQSIEKYINNLRSQHETHQPSDEPVVFNEDSVDNQSGDGLVVENKAQPQGESKITVEFIEPEEFRYEENLQVDQEFFEPLKDLDTPYVEAEHIKNDINKDMEDDVKTYFRPPLNLDRFIEEEEIQCEDCLCYEYEEIETIDLERVIKDEEHTNKDLDFSLDEEELDCCAEIDIDIDKEIEDEQVLLKDQIIDDIQVDDIYESEYDLDDYDKEIIEQYEKVFNKVGGKPNEEVINISRADYEHNRKVIQRDQTTDYIKNILKYFPEEDPFRQNLKGYSWWRIDFLDEAKGFLPYFNYVSGGKKKIRNSGNLVTAKDLMSLYNHYLFGMYSQKNEVKYYIYAIPGGFYKEEHPHGGDTGFNTWFEGNEIIGYWLLYIDALTGEVIYPLNPMIPVD